MSLRPIPPAEPLTQPLPPHLSEPFTEPSARTRPFTEPPAATEPFAEPSAGTAPFAEAEPPAKTRSRRGPLLITAAATLAVLAGTAFAVGAFDSAPEDTRAFPGITTAPTSVAEATPSPTPSRTTSPTATATATASRKTLPAPTRSATRPATPSRKATTAPPTTPQPPPSTPPQHTPDPKPPKDQVPPGSLAQGSSGPDVRELQDRLQQLGLYDGPPDGRYTQDVTDSVARFQAYMSIDDEPEGVYGPQTRERLESWTNEP
ncbi:peptidoglycan-binding protein [Streptomyces sp. NPDC087440]|uniref:peptidoglycan-binding domain-containing protein n=1 Tax=Streptomyces sp. NPDC087440 TaxID=3365790 RepID=UPI0038293B12